MVKLPKGFETIDVDLYPFQKETLAFGIQRDNAGLLLDMGLGKTLISINIARYRIQNNNVKKVLVICPNTIMYSWEKSIKRFSEYEPLIVNSSPEERIYRSLEKDHKFHILGYGSLYPLLDSVGVWKYERTKDGKKKRVLNKLDALWEFGYDMVIYDESAKFLRNFASQRSLASNLFTDYSKYRLILTGTLIANRPTDIFQQFRVLDGGKEFGVSYYAFLGKYFDKIFKGTHNEFILKRRYYREFTEKIYRNCIRFTRQEVLPDLPPVIKDTRIVPLDNYSRDEYEKIKQKTIVEIETSVGKRDINIPSIFAKLIRVSQVASGFIGYDNGQVAELKTTPKLDALIEEIDTINDYGESAVVFCEFRKSISMISERLRALKIDHIIMTGDDSAKEKYNKWHGFQTTNTPVFIAQIQSGDVGIELFKIDGDADKSQHMLFYEQPWNPDIKDQAEARSNRIGTKQTLRIVDFAAEGTIDEKKLTTLGEKRKVADAIMEGGIRKFLE